MRSLGQSSGLLFAEYFDGCDAHTSTLGTRSG